MSEMTRRQWFGALFAATASASLGAKVTTFECPCLQGDGQIGRSLYVVVGEGTHQRHHRMFIPSGIKVRQDDEIREAVQGRLKWWELVK